MAFPKEKTDWSSHDSSLDEEPHPSTQIKPEKNKDTDRGPSNLRNKEFGEGLIQRRNTNKKVEFFKSISIDSTRIPQDRLSSESDSRLLVHNKQLNLDSILTTSKNYLSKGPKSLFNLKQLLKLKTRQRFSRENSRDALPGEIYATLPDACVSDYDSGRDGVVPEALGSLASDINGFENSHQQKAKLKISEGLLRMKAASLLRDKTIDRDHPEENYDLVVNNGLSESCSSGDYPRQQTRAGDLTAPSSAYSETIGPSREASASNLYRDRSLPEISGGTSRRTAVHDSRTPNLADAFESGAERQNKQEDPVIRCPSCHTRFYVDGEVLSKYQQSGRKPQFHCSKCDHVFSSSITAHTPDLTIDDVKQWRPSGDAIESASTGDSSGTRQPSNTDEVMNNHQVKGDGFVQVPSPALPSSGGIANCNKDNKNPIAIDEPQIGAFKRASTAESAAGASIGGISVHKAFSTSSNPPFANHVIEETTGLDDDQPLVPHFADEVKPQNIPWEVKRSTSEGSISRTELGASNSSVRNLEIENNQGISPSLGMTEITAHSSENQGHQSPSASGKFSKGLASKSLHPFVKKGSDDGLSIWTIAKKALSAGSARSKASKTTSVAHPYLNSSQRRPNSAPIEIAGPDSDQLSLSLRPSKPSAWNFLSTLISRGPRERWVGTVLISTPLVLTVLTLAIFSYSIRFSLPAYEFMVSSLGLKGSEIAPVGLTVHDAAFKSVTLESGETVYTISGRIINSTDREFKEVSVEGLTFDSQGQLTSRGAATLGNALNIAKLKALPLEDILSLQLKKRDTSSVLRPGQSDRFIIALSDRHRLEETSPTPRSSLVTNARSSAEDLSPGSPLAATEFFSARVYLVK